MMMMHQSFVLKPDKVMCMQKIPNGSGCKSKSCKLSLPRLCTKVSNSTELAVLNQNTNRRFHIQILLAGSYMLFLKSLAQASTVVTVKEDFEGSGKHPAQIGDLVLVHYVGRISSTNQIFDSTRGGLVYRDGGMGVYRPAALRLGGPPVPGITEGLQQAIVGMTVGGKRVAQVPAEAGFGFQGAIAPYAIVPSQASLTYEIELLRLSTRGPDELTKGISRCGTGGMSETAERCGEISVAEFL